MKRRRRRPRRSHTGRPTTLALAPNVLWTADFKGQVRMGNGRYCVPLTVADGFSRFLLGCKAMHFIDRDQTRTSFEFLFRTYWPARADSHRQRLSIRHLRPGPSLSAFRLVDPPPHPPRAHPARLPQQNGSHERMHRTFRAETTRPPEPSLRSQQRRFDAFRDTFNRVKPHEAFNQTYAGLALSCLASSLPRKAPPLEYPHTSRSGS